MSRARWTGAFAGSALAAALVGFGLRAACSGDSETPEATSARWTTVVGDRLELARRTDKPEVLADLAVELEVGLLTRYPVIYAERTQQLAKGSAQWPGTRAREVSKVVYDVVAGALTKTAGRIPALKWSDLAWIVADYGQPWASEPTDAWSRRRGDIARILLKSVKCVREIIDPKWDVDDPGQQPVQRVPLPKGVIGIPGMSPEGIKDPILRKEYENAIAENQRKVVRRSEQIRAREFDKQQVPHVLQAVASMYRQIPSNSTELSALAKDALLTEMEVKDLFAAAGVIPK